MATVARARARASAGEYFTGMMSLGLRLIPLDVGGKATHERAWAQSGESTLAGLVARAGAHWRVDAGDLAGVMSMPLRAWVEALPSTGWNVGNLHEGARTACLDMDHPLALEALRAGVRATGGPADYVPRSALSWASPRGVKCLWAAPAGARSAALRSRSRHPNGSTAASVILEVRASGQDMVPPGWRADVGRALAWEGPLPERLPAMPVEVERVLRAILEGDLAVIHAMQIAAGTTADMLGLDAVHVEDYPSRLAGCVHERKLVNAHLPVADLLTAHGYERRGGRWSPAGSLHAGGIVEPSGSRADWHCWHESDPLAGRFDAWRAYVTLEHAGDLAAARAAARRDFRPRLTSVGDPPGPPQGGEMRTTLSGISDDEKMPQRGKVPPDEMPARASKRPARASEGAGGTTTPGEGHGGAVGDLPAGAPKRPARASEGGSGRVVAAPSRGDARGASTAVPGALGLARDGWGAVSAGGLYDADLPEVGWVVEGSVHLAAGCYLLAGKPKSGKSWLALGLAMLVAGDVREYAGARARRTGPVLYVGVDDSPDRRMARRLREAARGERPGENLSWVESWPPEGFEGDRLQALEAYILARRPAMAVVDTLVAFREAERSSAVFQQEYDELKELQSLAVRHGVLIVVTHHLNKLRDVDPEDPFISISGTHGLQAAVDGMLVLVRAHSEDAPEEHLGGLWSRTRDHDEQSRAMRLRDGRWEDLGVGAGAIFSYGVRRLIEEHVLSLPASQWVTAQEVHGGVSEFTEVKLAGVRSAMRRMAAEGLLESRKGSAGGYRMTGRRRAELAGGRKF